MFATLAMALMLAVGMLWHVAWSLIFGLTLSGAVQALVSKERMHQTLGRNGWREIALATLFGAASSSCSYAAAAMSKTLFKGGAGFLPSLAFLFSSTNLVLELGLLLWVLIGWQFTAAEWFGGIILIAVATLFVRLTYPKGLIEEARASVDNLHAHEHGTVDAEGSNLWAKLRNKETQIAIAQNAWMDFSMLWRDLLIGFVIAGVLGAFVSDRAWGALFVHSASPLTQSIQNALLGPVLAVITFVCSIGNVPMAAILWGSGISFGGVLAYLYADILILPLLNVYRRYYGWKMAAYMFGIFYAAIVVTAIIVNEIFTRAHWLPSAPVMVRADLMRFNFDYTFYLNVVALIVGAYVWRLQNSAPSEHCCHGE